MWLWCHQVRAVLGMIRQRIGRLVGLGIRQSRYFGRAKTQFQALMAATVTNLTLVAGWVDSEGTFGDFLRHFLGRFWQRVASMTLLAVFPAGADRKPTTAAT